MSTDRLLGKAAFSIASIWLGAMILSLLLVKFAPVPFLLIGGLWAILGFITAAKATARHQTVWLIFASICIALSAGEFMAFLLLPPQPKMVIEAGTFPIEPDGDLGWRNVPGATSRITNQIGTTVYSFRITIDGAGHRISPPDLGQGVQGCAVFFADSFTYGQGVNDEEAYPYRVGLRTSGRFRIVNLGVPGYGAHHMLAQLERDEVVTALRCTPTHVFYLALPDHVRRLSNGPRYELGDDGEVHRTLQRSLASQLIRGLKFALSGMEMYQLLNDRFQTEETDLNLYFAVVARAAKLAKLRWPSAQLHILAWNLDAWYAIDFDHFRAGLARSGWQVHEVDAVLPGYQKNPTRYSLHRFDLHPNSLAHDLLAAFIANSILTPSLYQFSQ